MSGGKGRPFSRDTCNIGHGTADRKLSFWPLEGKQIGSITWLFPSMSELNPGDPVGGPLFPVVREAQRYNTFRLDE